jgi:hypothetical protein
MTDVTLPLAKNPANVWCDRSTHWSVALGPFQIARSTTQVRYLGPPGHVDRSSANARAIAIWGTAMLVVAGWLSWGFSAQASAQRPRFVTPIMDVPAPAPARTSAIELKPSEPKGVEPRAKAAPAQMSSGEPGTANFDAFPAVRRAVEAAFQTGEAQDWAEGPYQGLVVAGAAYADGGKTCRDTAILLRDGSFDGITKSSVTCHAAGGGKPDPGQAAASETDGMNPA